MLKIDQIWKEIKLDNNYCSVVGFKFRLSSLFSFKSQWVLWRDKLWALALSCYQILKNWWYYRVCIRSYWRVCRLWLHWIFGDFLFLPSFMVCPQLSSEFFRLIIMIEIVTTFQMFISTCSHNFYQRSSIICFIRNLIFPQLPDQLLSWIFHIYILYLSINKYIVFVNK